MHEPRRSWLLTLSLAALLVLGAGPTTFWLGGGGGESGSGGFGGWGLSGVALGAPSVQPGGGGAGGQVKATSVSQKAKASPGDQFAVAVVLEYEENWHSWPNKPVLPKELEGVDARPTEVALTPGKPLPAGVTLYPLWAQYPEPEEAEVTGAMVLAYSERAVIYVPVMIAPDARPGIYVLPLQVSYQACDKRVCARPTTDEVPLELEIVPLDAAPPAASSGDDLFKGFSPQVFAKILAGGPGGPADGPAGPAAKLQSFDFFGYSFSVDSSFYALILGIAFLAGLLMNFTPCVLPVIPIKVLSLQSHAKHPGKLLLFGSVYCLGVITLYGILGLLAFGLITGGRRFDWGQIFSIPWFVIAMSLVITALSLGMMGLFTIRLPNFVYAVNPTGDSVTGNFIGGLLTGVLAVPCTGPLLGATLAWILTQPPALGVATYLVMGAGMASPYAVLMAFPSLIKKVPRGGPGSELVKQVMGVFMLAVAAYLASNLVEGEWKWGVVFGVATLGCGWWLYGAVTRLRTPMARVVSGALAVLMAVGFIGAAVVMTRPPPVAWRYFVNQPDSEVTKAIEQAVKSGKVVVVDFTANWCVNCHVIEKRVIYSETGLAAINAPDVVAIRVDLTDSGEEQGWGVVRQISGGGGIPLIAVFGPGLPKPIFYQSFFKPSDLAAAIDKARKG